MAYPRGQLRDLCRRRLGDLAVPYKWSDLQVNQWINDAIADYSIHFPRRVALKIDCATGMHTYDLPADCHAVLRVEYPHGEYPPKYLQLSDSASPFFYDSGYLYDFAPAMDADTPGQIIISASPLSIEDIEIIYQGDHTYLDDDAGEVTVLDRHLELVMLYVRWAAYQELATTESSDPDQPGAEHAGAERLPGAAAVPTGIGQDPAGGINQCDRPLGDERMGLRTYIDKIDQVTDTCGWVQPINHEGDSNHV